MAPRKKVEPQKTSVSLTPKPTRTLVTNPPVSQAASKRAARSANAPTAGARVSAVKPSIKVNVPITAIRTVITNLGSVLQSLIAVNQPPVPLPPKILGTLRQPDGSSGDSLQMEVLPPSSVSTAQQKATIFGASTSGSQVLAAGLTDSDGNFSIPLPGGVTLPPGESLAIRARGSSPTTVAALKVDPSVLGPLGYVGTMTLAQPLPPIPLAIYAQLLAELTQAAGGPTANGTTPPSVPKLTLGDDADCIRVLENQVSFEQYPYGMFFELISPQLYAETESVNRDQAGVYQSVTRSDTPINRSYLAGPISIDDFHNALLTGPAIVGSLGLGYVLRCSQNWTFQGLALGDLVYSLPLAPGEQQQVVVEEQTTTLVVRETESVYGAETSQASAATDSSTQATFQSAFHQAAQGGSSYNAFSETGAMTFGGGLLGILGGPSGSIGETVSTGSTHNWMDGLQNYASSASQSVQTYAEQQSSAQRRATRTAMRMASATETVSVTTKTITNHNKLHALTMQYFEVLRLFDVSTSFDDVSLVCLVPLDIVWFLPPGQKQHLDDVITDADVSNAIQYASELNSALQNMDVQVQMAIAFSAVPFFSGFVQNTVNNVKQQLTAAVTTATQLDALLSGLGSGYATQTNEAAQLLNQINQATAAIAAYPGPPQVTDLQNALSFLSSGVNLATALYQQLSNTSLVSGTMSRQQVLDRYQGLLAHSDVLQRWLPPQYASGLSRLDKFASDPRASLVIDSLAEDVIRFSANASVLPFDHIYVAAVTRWGSRIGPVELIPNPPVSVPGEFDNSKAFKTPDDLMQYLRGQRNPGTSTAPRLQATIALPRTLSPTDVVGFEITHGMDSFTYELATPLDLFTSFFGTNGAAWPAGVFPGLAALIAPPVVPHARTYSAHELAQQLGPPFFWNFRAELTASVRGNTESYVRPDASVVELPPGIYPIPAMDVAPLLKYSDLILIENTLQHVLRNVVLYSKAVWTWMTPEERVMLLEPYLLSFPGISSTVPLLDCVGNVVLGFYGNCMMMPFSIPQALGDQKGQGWPMTTGELEDALLRFHKQSAPHAVTRTMLPTRGVLGEAMLGHCASGEKIDLTRFWNWQDSPADTAPAIAPVTVPGAQLTTLATAQGPNQLGPMLPSLVNNVNAPTVTPTDALAVALAGRAPAATFPDLTGSAQLAQLLQSTQTTANQARQDQLAQQTTLTKDAIDQASAVLQAYLTGKPAKSGNGNGSSSSSDSSSSSAGKSSSSGASSSGS